MGVVAPGEKKSCLPPFFIHSCTSECQFRIPRPVLSLAELQFLDILLQLGYCPRLSLLHRTLDMSTASSHRR